MSGGKGQTSDGGNLGQAVRRTAEIDHQDGRRLADHRPTADALIRGHVLDAPFSVEDVPHSPALSGLLAVAMWRLKVITPAVSSVSVAARAAESDSQMLKLIQVGRGPYSWPPPPPEGLVEVARRLDNRLGPAPCHWSAVRVAGVVREVAVQPLGV